MTRQINLSTIHLETGSHSPNSHYCVMELTAALAGEPWSDHPLCVSPTIAAFLRSWNDALPDPDRQQLIPYAERVIGTNASAAEESARLQLLTDWLLRTFTPAWLDLAGLTSHAATISALPPTTEPHALLPLVQAARDAARDADRGARDAAWVAAGEAAFDAAWVAARHAVRHAAGDAAWVAAGETAGAAGGAGGAWAAARVAAWHAAGVAAWHAAGAAARYAAWVAAWVAARDAARDAALIAAGARLAPTVIMLQASAFDLLDRMMQPSSLDLPDRNA